MRKLVLSDFVQTAYVVLDDTGRHGKEMKHSKWKESGETDFFFNGKAVIYWTYCISFTLN